MSDHLNIAVIGAGAMGTCLAALLGPPHTVIMVCRNPARAAEIVQVGAAVHGCIEHHATPIVVRSISDLARFGRIDLIFVATKTTAIPGVAAELKRTLAELRESHPQPAIISFQNGIEPGRELMSLLDTDSVLRMVVHLGATLRADDGSAVVHFNQEPHRIGCLSERLRPSAESVARLLTDSGLATVFEERIEVAVWQKAIANAAANPVCALVDSRLGDVLDAPSCRIVRQLLREGVEVAVAEGLDLGDDYIDRIWETLIAARDHTPSMVEDIRAGRESEVGQLNRQIIEHGTRVGVPTPTHEIIDALIETFDFQTYQRSSRATD